MKSFFITATDTGVGKTTITAAIASLLKSQGIDVGVMKPFATGEQQKTGYKSKDVATLADSAQTNDPEEMINSYFFPIPASPYTAANKLNASIDTNLVLQSFEKLQKLHRVVLVEGIGGILTPILKDYCVADMIKEMNLDTIIVCDTKLGTINHTLLTVKAAKDFGLSVKGIIINNMTSNGYNPEELRTDLTNLCGVDVLCAVPHFVNISINNVAKALQNTNLVSCLSS